VRRRGNPKPFLAATAKVAAERHFYKLQPATADDVALLRLALLERVPDYVKERCELLIRNLTMPFVIKDALDPNDPHFKELSDWLDEFIINAEEQIQCDMESQLVKVLGEMINGKTDFYSNDDAAQEFIHAVCFQYMRTKKLRVATEALPIPPNIVPGADIKRSSNLHMLLSAMVVGDTIYRRRKQLKTLLLDNPTTTPLIAGDQPIVNIHATFREGVMPERLEFFYPLSPTRAMAFVEVATEIPPIMSGEEVQRLNEMMVWHSYEQVFSNSRDYLDSLPLEGSESTPPPSA
jgi:hypothetical protein